MIETEYVLQSTSSLFNYKGKWYNPREIGRLFKRISYNIVRYQGTCLYFQNIPSDGYRGDETLNARTHVDIFKNLQFTSRMHSSNGEDIFRTLTRISVAVTDTYNIRRNPHCDLGNRDNDYLDTHLWQLPVNLKNFYVYIGQLNTPVIIQPDVQPIYIENLNAFETSGLYVVCRWVGMSVKIGMEDSTPHCISQTLLANTPDSSDFKCGNIHFPILSYPNKSVALDEYLLYVWSNTTTFDFEEYIMNNIFWTFAIDNNDEYLYMYLVLRLVANDECVEDLDDINVNMFSVVQILKRGGGIKPYKISYFATDSYTDVFAHDFVAWPTFFSTGIDIDIKQTTLKQQNCHINITYYHKLLNTYSEHLMYVTIWDPLEDTYTQKNNQWRICWQKRCYLMRDDKFIPEESSWTEAQAFCTSKNANLISFNSDAEQAVVLQWVQNRRRIIPGKKQYGFSTIWRRSTLMFLGLREKVSV